MIEILGNSLPQASPTLINYTMLQGFALYPAQLLLVGPFILSWFYRIIAIVRWRSSEITSREISDSQYPSLITSINYGIAYPIPILIWFVSISNLRIVGILYAPIAPIISIFVALFFSVAYIVYKYILLYCHIPAFETGGAQAPMAVRRCLLGMSLMQLTMYVCPCLMSRMGVLALKSTTNTARDDSYWSSYVSYVLYTMPLLFLTFALYWWYGICFNSRRFKHGYEKEVVNFPLDLLAKIARDVGPRSTERDIGVRDDGEELDSMTIPVVRQKTSTSHVSFRNVIRRKESLSSLGAAVRIDEENVWDSREIEVGDRTTPPDDIVEDLPRSVPDEGPVENDMHLDPPSTRVFGVLDTPLESSIPVVPNMDSDDLGIDLTLFTYLHPALIGRLPTAWLVGDEQPRRLVEAREEQKVVQRQMWRRVVGRQRAGLSFDQGGDDGGEEDVHASLLGGSERRRRRTRSGARVQDRVKSFVDGVASWINLQMG